jgi:uncharacterized SAM-binding protein YcdF (DUF218 family)
MPFDLALFKPVLTTLIMPPALGLLILGLGWYARRRLPVLGTLLMTLGLVGSWIMSCNGFAVALSRGALPYVAPILPDQIKTSLADQRVQAIIVLGGGMEMASREYGMPQPSDFTIARMHYGLFLSKATGLPLGFSGGIGHASSSASSTEAAAVQRWLAQLGLPAPRWLEGRSRDTRENAAMIAPVLAKDQIQRIALVTHAWHMPRAQRAFEAAGLTVLPAPMDYIEPKHDLLLEWLPSAEGLRQTRHVLRELLGTAMGQ